MHLIKSSRNLPLTLFSSHFSSCTLLNNFPALRFLEKQSITLANDVGNNLCINNSSMLVGCCNGLLCFLDVSINIWDQKVYFSFFNPATRSLSKKLGYFCFSVLNGSSCFKFSLDFDNLTSKYKVVAFRPNEVRVFTLGDYVWRNIQTFPVYPYSTRNHVNGGVYLNNISSPYYNSLNWFAHRNNITYSYYHWEYFTINKFVIISLDLGTETYTQLMPPMNFDEVELSMPNLCALMDCLCFSHHSQGDNFVKWQMMEFGVEESWTKLLKFNCQQLLPCYLYFDYRRLLPLYIFENGDVLIWASEEGYAIRYNKSDERIVDKTRMTNKLYWFLAQHYVESMVPAC
ncbi:F-box/kelch-repeat protein At3g23880-like [Vicia villosa]|uniref:F-box/kelch-repeat protein At3g23880-like n=1 Tax=Vicia villosa TaxID=3911 RepID=UPI00273ABFD5|nr:F-box/kelch-repeat protein At3g23880-like [Vicia villosa]